MDITHNITAVLAAPNYSATYQKRISNIPNIRLIIKLLNFRLYSNTSRPDYACPAFRSISCDNASAFSLTSGSSIDVRRPSSETILPLTITSFAGRQ